MSLERIVFVATLVLAGLLGKSCYDRGVAAKAVIEFKLAATTDSLEKEREAARVLETAHAGDLVQFQTEIAAWRSLKQRIRVVEKWDTLPPSPPDTVVGPERIVRDTASPPTLLAVIRQADATIASCQTALASSESICDNLKRRLTLTESQRDLYRSQRPSTVSTWFWRAVWFEAGRVSSGKFP